MFSTSAKPVLANLLRPTRGTHRQEGLQQKKRYTLHSLRGLVCLFSLTLSACAAQPFPPTLSLSNVQETKQLQLPRQQPIQSVAADSLDKVAMTAPQVFARGQEAIQAGQYERATILFEQATQLDGTNALYYLWLGRAYGYRAEQTQAGNQFFLARQVRKNLEKAVTLNPDLIEARLDLLTYYLQAPSLLGGGIEKAQAQAAEITNRDPQQGARAWRQCQQAEKEEPPLFAVSR